MPYIYSRGKHRRSGSTMQKMKWRGGNKRHLAAREVLPGYPWEGRFETHNEIKTYLHNIELTCLLCGKPYRNLGIHTIRIHGVSADDYKFKFNIPANYGGLIGQETKQLCTEMNLNPAAQARIRALGKKPKSKPAGRGRFCDLAKKASGHQKQEQKESA